MSAKSSIFKKYGGSASSVDSSEVLKDAVLALNAPQKDCLSKSNPRVANDGEVRFKDNTSSKQQEKIESSQFDVVKNELLLCRKETDDAVETLEYRKINDSDDMQKSATVHDDHTYHMPVVSSTSLKNLDRQIQIPTKEIQSKRKCLSYDTGTEKKMRGVFSLHRSSSPLSSASEMLEMLQRLPMNLKNIQTSYEASVPSLKPVVCRAPVKRSRRILIRSDNLLSSQDPYKANKKNIISTCEAHPLKAKKKFEITSMIARSMANTQDCVANGADHRKLETKIHLLSEEKQSNSSKPLDALQQTIYTEVPMIKSTSSTPNTELTLAGPERKPIDYDKLSLKPTPQAPDTKVSKPGSSAFSGNHPTNRGSCHVAGHSELSSELEKLKNENNLLKEEKTKLEETLQKCKGKITNFDTKVCTLLRSEKELYEKLQALKGRLGWKGISSSSAQIKFYTGLPDAASFEWVLELCIAKPISYQQGWRVTNLSAADQLLAVLMLFKLNFKRQVLATWFDVSACTIANIERTWVPILHRELFLEYFENPLSPKRKDVPQYFPVNSASDNVHGFVKIEKSVLTIQNRSKQVGVLKGLLGVSSNGLIVSASKLYEDMPERDIIYDSGLLNKLHKGDLLVDLDLGPEINNDYRPSSFQLLQKGLSLVDKALHSVKDFTVLEQVPVSLVPLASEVWQVCAALTCLRKSVAQSRTTKVCEKMAPQMLVL